MGPCGSESWTFPVNRISQLSFRQYRLNAPRRITHYWMSSVNWFICMFEFPEQKKELGWAGFKIFRMMKNVPPYIWGLKWALRSFLHPKIPSAPQSAAAPSLHPVSTHKQTNSYIKHTQTNTKQVHNRQKKTQAWIHLPEVEVIERMF